MTIARARPVSAVWRLSVPARVNILGNPGDANEGDFATITAAVNLRAEAEIEAAGDYVLEQEGEGMVAFEPGELPLPYDGRLDLLKAALNRLYAHSPELRHKLPRAGFRLFVRSDVPRQSGLGGSSLIALLALAGLRARYDLDRRAHHDYLLAELCQRAEENELGITAGYADRYVPLFGGLCYVDYRGKLHHRPVGEEPLATVERLDGITPRLSFLVVMTGVRHHSGDVHGRMRPRYLAEHAEWQATGRMPPLVSLMSRAYECAWRGKMALLAGDLATFGSLMTTNHQLVDEMMIACGFSDGVGWANRSFIDAAMAAGALGAKLTGAGGGGSVLALVEPAEEGRVLAAWAATAAGEGLHEARAVRLNVVRHGLRVACAKGSPRPRRSPDPAGA
jgi:galactokinase